MAATEERLLQVNEVGPVVASSLLAFFADPLNRQVVDKLLEAQIHWPLVEVVQTEALLLGGKTIVITGTLPTLSREQAAELIEQAGGKVQSSVSKKTSMVLAGADAGSKLVKAQELTIPVISEADLLQLLEATATAPSTST